jgi:hypothetical protein
MRPSRILLLLVVAAVLGVGVFVYLASNTVTVERADDSEAMRQFQAARAAFGATPPMLEVDATGRVVRHASPPSEDVHGLRQLRVLVFQAQQRRLIRSDVPFWFVTIKGPALQFALRGTGVDLEGLGVTAADIRRHGPGPILDETRSNGDRILVWVE